MANGLGGQNMSGGGEGLEIINSISVAVSTSLDEVVQVTALLVSASPFIKQR